MSHTLFTKQAEHEFTYNTITAVSLLNLYANLNMQNEMNAVSELSDDIVDSFLNALHTVDFDSAVHMLESMANELVTAVYEDELPTHTLAFALHRGSTLYDEFEKAYGGLIETLPVTNRDVLEVISDILTRMTSRTLDAKLLTVEDKELLMTRLEKVGDRKPVTAPKPAENPFAEYINELHERGIKVDILQPIHPKRLNHSWYGRDVLRVDFTEKSGYPTMNWCELDSNLNTQKQLSKIKTAIIHADGKQVFTTGALVKDKYYTHNYTDHDSSGIMIRAVLNMPGGERRLHDDALNELISNGNNPVMSSLSKHPIVPLIHMKSNNAWFIRYYDENGKLIGNQHHTDGDESLLLVLRDVVRTITREAD